MSQLAKAECSKFVAFKPLFSFENLPKMSALSVKFLAFFVHLNCCHSYKKLTIINFKPSKSVKSCFPEDQRIFKSFSPNGHLGTKGF